MSKRSVRKIRHRSDYVQPPSFSERVQAGIARSKGTSSSGEHKHGDACGCEHETVVIGDETLPGE